jgi:hypothetical protein
LLHFKAFLGMSPVGIGAAITLGRKDLTMKRVMSAGVLFVLGALSMGAKGGGGCSADYAPGDGSSKSWPTGPLPTVDANIQPMSCEWLDGDNCWKRFVAKAKACEALVASEGTFATDRASCGYASGAEWEFSGALDTPAKGSTQFPIADWRILEPGGATACITGKILGVGKTLLDIDGEVVLFESPTVTSYHLTCSDGTTWGSDQPGTCKDFGARYLAHETPGLLWTCDGSANECTISFWGTDQGDEQITKCGG